MTEKENQKKLNDIIKQKRGTVYKIKAIIGEGQSKPAPMLEKVEVPATSKLPQTTSAALKNVSNIFGSAELLD